MSNRFVRASKYRHVFGRPTRKEQCYDNLHISRNAWDTNLIKANPHYLSVNWESSGGGAFAVIPINEKGRLPERIPLFRGHTAVVLDTDWNPFDDSVIASGSDDGKAFVWRVPDDFSLYSDAEDPTDITPVTKLSGHSRKVGHVLWNPAGANILATSSGDYTIKIWDVEAGSPRLTIKHTDVVQSLSWSANGALMVTTSRDKKLRIWDVRQERPAHVVPGHSGAKNSRAVWMGEHDRVATTGFSKMSDRQLGLWDIRDPKEPVGGFTMLDSISGVCMPFWDDSTKCLYLAGKGDGNIRYFEYENDTFEYLSEYKSSDPQRGLAFLPKRGLNVRENEVMRAFKTVNDNYIEPISFLVPRRAEVFQGDIFPPVTGSRPAMSAAEWFGGKDGIPPKIDLEKIYEGEEPTEVPSTYVPAITPVVSTPPAKKESEPIKEVAKEPVPPSASMRGPPPSIKEQSQSISRMASKYADKDDEEEEDDESSFEEVTKPVETSEKPIQPTLKAVETLAEKPVEKSEPVAVTKGLYQPSQKFADSGPSGTDLWKADPNKLERIRSNESDHPSTAPKIAQFIPPPTSTSPPSSATADHPSSIATQLPPTPIVPGANAAGEPIHNYLQEIKALLQQQNLTMAQQSEKISALTSEVDTLKTGLNRSGGIATPAGASGDNKDEKIEGLEKELARLRSLLLSKE